MTWTVGQSAPSASLQRIQNDLEGLMHHLVVVPFRGTSEAGKMGKRETWKTEFSKRKCQVLLLVRSHPMHQCMVDTRCLESSFSERDLRVLVGDKLTMNQQCATVTKMAGSLLGCIRKTVSSRSKEVIFPLYLAVVRHTWVLCPGLGSPVQGRHGLAKDHEGY